MLPQPKLNFALRFAGAATSRTVASATLPPCVQALTIHWADCPRLMLACVDCTATQRLTRAAWLAGLLNAATLAV